MGFWRFSYLDPSAAPLLDESYDPGLVLLSIVIACFAGYTALLMTERMIASRFSTSLRISWNCCGALVMGCGIWTMHFTGMLAFDVPIPVAYDPGLTLLSLVPAILGSGVALHFMAQPTLTLPRAQLGALLMAVGIGTMHYTGMEALGMDGLRYDLFLFCLSIVVAHVMALLSIYVQFGVRRMSRFPAGIVKTGAAIIMGNAVASMHYTAMAAARFYDAPGAGVYGWGFTDVDMMAGLIASTTVILAIGIMATWIDRNWL